MTGTRCARVGLGAFVATLLSACAASQTGPFGAGSPEDDGSHGAGVTCESSGYHRAFSMSPAVALEYEWVAMKEAVEESGPLFAELCLVNEPMFGVGPQVSWQATPPTSPAASSGHRPGMWRLTVVPGTDIVDEVWVK